MSSIEELNRSPSQQWGLAAVGALGIGVAAALAGYGRVHPGNGADLLTLGFSGALQMKAWLTTVAAVLIVAQVMSALAMWGRLPFVANVPGWVSGLHRWTGTLAFLVTLPVAFQCVWSLGLASDSTRTLVHSAAGCLFYGAFAAKMLSLRLGGLPRSVLPILGGLVAALMLVLWFTAALWFFTQPGLAKF